MVQHSISHILVSQINFTQVIWKATIELGIGYTTHKSDELWYFDNVVARYFPPGNRQGSFESNVFQKANLNN